MNMSHDLMQFVPWCADHSTADRADKHIQVYECE